MFLNLCNVMWLAGSSSCSTLLYSVFIHTASELYVCPTTCPGLSSSQQHLVICALEINTIIMCGTLFALSQCSVFSTLNQFCHSVDTPLGLSHCVVHIRGGLCCSWLHLNAASCLAPALSSAYLNAVFTDGVWHGGPYRWLRGRGQVKWNWWRERSGDRKE